VTRLREGHGPCLQVVDKGETAGLLTLENVGEFLMVRSALAKQGGIPADQDENAIGKRFFGT
jgi:hypothetical protein